MTQKNCQITFQGMPAVEAAKVEVHAWLERLGSLTTRMTGGHVVIEPLDERRKERRYQVRIEIAMPGQVVMIGHDQLRNAAHEDVYVAIRNAFRAAKAPLEAYRAAQPSELEPKAQPEAATPLDAQPELATGLQAQAVVPPEAVVRAGAVVPPQVEVLPEARPEAKPDPV